MAIKQVGKFGVNVLKSIFDALIRRPVGVGQMIAEKTSGVEPGEIQRRLPQLQQGNAIQQALASLSGATSLTPEEAADPNIIPKAYAGQAAYMIPAGKAAQIGGKAIPALLMKILAGSGAGAASGFGASKQGEELESTVGGGIVGGAIPGVIGLGTKLASKITAPKLPSVTGSALNPKPGFTKEVVKMQKVADDIGITDKLKANEKVGKIDSAFDRWQAQIAALLKGSKPVAKDVVQENFNKNYNNSNIDTSSKATQRLLTLAQKKLNEALGDNVKLNQLKTFARKEMGNTFRTGGENPTQRQEVWGVVYNTAKDSLDSVSDNIRTINGNQKILFDLADEFVPKMKDAAQNVQIAIPMTRGGLIQTPVSKEGLSRAVGGVAGAVTAPVRAVGKAGAQVSNLLSKLPPELQQLLSPAAVTTSMAGEQPAQPVVPGQQSAAPAPDITGSPEEVLTQLTAQGVSPEIAQQFIQGMGAASAPPADQTGAMNITPEIAALAQIMLSPKEAAKIESAYDIQKESSKVSAADAKSNKALSTVENNVNQMETLLNEVPTGLGALQDLVGSKVPFTDLSTETRVFNGIRESMIGPMARLVSQEVGVLTDKDVARAQGLLAGVTDGEKTRKRKFEELRKALSNISPDQVQARLEGQYTYSGSKYDPSELGLATQ